MTNAMTDVSDERLDELILLAEGADKMWGDESSRTALAGWRELKRRRASDDAKDAARYRFIKKHGMPQATRAPDGSRLWYKDRISDNVEMVRPKFDDCVDAAMGDQHG